VEGLTTNLLTDCIEFIFSFIECRSLSAILNALEFQRMVKNQEPFVAHTHWCTSVSPNNTKWNVEFSCCLNSLGRLFNDEKMPQSLISESNVFVLRN
jgi:hypothetical protein